MATKPQGQQIDLSSLTAPQLTQIKNQLNEELEHLTSSFTQLRAAQAKFRDCITALKMGVSGKTEGKAILVPLTTSLYVPGTIADTEKVIVDVGTGFFVEKDTATAKVFYEGKVEELGVNLKDLEAIVQGKSGNLRVVEDVLRQKVLAASSSGSTSTAAA